MNNRLLVYNCFQQKFCAPEAINPTLPNQKYMYTDQSGFQCYLFTLSSDILPKSENFQCDKIHFKFAKFSLFTFFQEKFGRIQVQDFMIYNKKVKNEQEIITKLIGQKQILLSNEFIENADYKVIVNSQAVPFYHEDKIKGCQLILNKNALTKEQREEQERGLHMSQVHKTSNYTKIQNKLAIINLLDQDINNLFKYKSEVVFVGNATFELDEKDDHQNCKVVSAMFRQSFIDKDIFSNQEAFLILRRATDRAMMMRVPNLNYILLNNFEDIKSKHFFQS